MKINTNKYIIGNITEIKQLLEQEKPGTVEFTNLLREALTGNHQHLITALFDYKNAYENLLSFSNYYIIDSLSFEQIHKVLHFLEIGLSNDELLRAIIRKENKNIESGYAQKQLIEEILSNDANINNIIGNLHLSINTIIDYKKLFFTSNTSHPIIADNFLKLVMQASIINNDFEAKSLQSMLIKEALSKGGSLNNVEDIYSNFETIYTNRELFLNDITVTQANDFIKLILKCNYVSCYSLNNILANNEQLIMQKELLKAAIEKGGSFFEHLPSSPPLKFLSAHKDILIELCKKPENANKLLELAIKSSVTKINPANYKFILDEELSNIRGELIDISLNSAITLQQTHLKGISDLKTLNDLSDQLLNHHKNPIDSQLFLKIIIEHSTVGYDQQTNIHGNNAELMKIKHDLIKKCFAKNATIANSLTLFHDKGHAFIKLECMDCANGEPVSIQAGLYPADNDICELDNNKFSTHHPQEEPTKLMSFIFFNKGLISILYDLTYPENTKRYDQYELTRESAGGFVSKPIYFNHNSVYDGEILKNIHSKSFNISKDNAELVFNQIMHLSSHCDKDYKYEGLTHNCVDFVQEMYNLAGYEGDHFNAMYTYKYPLTKVGAYKAFSDVCNSVSSLLHSTKLYFEDLF
jgi:hypothetical protein